MSQQVRSPVGPAPELPVVCRKLRAKATYDVGGDGPLWKLGDSTTAAYWCLSTMEPFGPDDHICHPHDCGAGRACYQRPDDAPDPGPAPRIA
jgi:hypothetical protein